MEIHKLTLEIENIREDEWKKAVQSAIDYAKMTIRLIVALNGAAALSLLTIAGHIYDQNNPMIEVLIDKLIPALNCFGWGALLGPTTAILAYFSQSHNSRLIKMKDEKKGKCVSFFANTYTVLAIMGALLSLYLFICGMHYATDAFRSI